MASTPETRYKNRLIAKLKKIENTWWRKIHGGPMQERGTPDYVGCVNSLFVAIELKSDKGKTSPLQDHTLAEIEEAGGYAFISSPSGKEGVANEKELIEAIECLARKERV